MSKMLRPNLEGMCYNYQSVSVMSDYSLQKDLATRAV